MMEHFQEIQSHAQFLNSFFKISCFRRFVTKPGTAYFSAIVTASQI